MPHRGSYLYLLKKNFVPAFSGAWTNAKVHGSRSLGFIMGAFMKTPFWLPEPFHDTLTWALASRWSSSLVRLRGIYDLRFYIQIKQINSQLILHHHHQLTIALISVRDRLSMLSICDFLWSAMVLTRAYISACVVIRFDE